MAITVPQSRLILRAFMSEMRNNLAASELVDWEVHSQEMNDRNGFVVSEQIGPEYVITETAASTGVDDLTTGVQDSVFGSQTFTINKVFGLSFGASDIESITDVQSARRSRALRNGVARLASRIDHHIFDTAGKAFPFSTGTWGTALSDPDHVARARTRLAEASLESDNDIAGTITHGDRQGLAKYLYDDNASLASEGSRAMRRGFAGMINNVPLMPSNQLGRLTTGTRTATTVDGATQNVNYKDVADSGMSGGYYLVQEFKVTTGTAETIKAGEVFSIAGIKAWDPEINAARPFDAQFVVLEDAVADGSTGNATLKIFPAMIVPTPNAKIGDAGVNSAHATVSAAPGNGDPVVWAASASTTVTTRAMWKRDAMVVHSAPLILPYTGQGFRRSLADAQRDGVAPLIPRIWFFSDPIKGDHKCRIDLFVQAQVRNRWQGVRMFGGT